MIRRIVCTKPRRQIVFEKWSGARDLNPFDEIAKPVRSVSDLVKASGCYMNYYLRAPLGDPDAGELVALAPSTGQGG